MPWDLAGRGGPSSLVVRLGFLLLSFLVAGGLSLSRLGAKGSGRIVLGSYRHRAGL